jgi:hypothetical protein
MADSFSSSTDNNSFDSISSAVPIKQASNSFDSISSAIPKAQYQPQEIYLSPNATGEDIKKFANAVGIVGDLAAKAPGFNDLVKANATGNGSSAYGFGPMSNATPDTNWFTKGLSNTEQGLEEGIRKIGRAALSLVRTPAEIELSKLDNAINQSNYAQRVKQGTNVDTHSGLYSKPIMNSVGEVVGPALLGGPIAGAARGALVEGGLGALALPTEGAIYGALSDPEHPITGATEGAVVGGVLKGTGMAASATAKGGARMLNSNGDALANEIVDTANALNVGKAVGIPEATGNTTLQAIQQFGAKTPFLKGPLGGLEKAAGEKAAIAQGIPNAARESLNSSAGGDALSILSKEHPNPEALLAQPLKDISPVFNTLSTEGKYATLSALIGKGAAEATKDGVINLGQVASHIKDMSSTLGLEGTSLKGPQAWSLQGLSSLLDATSNLQTIAQKAGGSDFQNLLGLSVLLHAVPHAIASPLTAVGNLGTEIALTRFSKWALNSPVARDALINLSAAKTTPQLSEALTGMTKIMSSSPVNSPIIAQFKDITQQVATLAPEQKAALLKQISRPVKQNLQNNIANTMQNIPKLKKFKKGSE